MAETHILQHVVMVVVATWWMKSWLMDPITARWRFVVAAMSGAVMWIVVAYTATRSIDGPSGMDILFGNMAIAYLAAFLAFVSVVGMILGLLTWTEEEAEESASQLPAGVRTGWSD